MNEFDQIIEWNKERGRTTFNDDTEFDMLDEELEEFTDACLNKNDHEIVDALCDMIVLATGAIFKLGYNPTIALSETVKEISSRVGSVNTITGKWEKEPNQDPATLYKADYTMAER